ncbi:MAG: hypothetical protein BYD32DRAFT_425519 [Podila humilis]|nr:MAG: hypothetical protein BYD32DRAFT_425519 [Podila humilis]
MLFKGSSFLIAIVLAVVTFVSRADAAPSTSASRLTRRLSCPPQVCPTPDELDCGKLRCTNPHVVYDPKACCPYYCACGHFLKARSRLISQ